MTIKRQHGFTLVEVLLSLIVVSFIAFAGYYVWNTQHKAAVDEPSPQPASSSSAIDDASAREVSSWRIHSFEANFSIHLPSGWTFGYYKDQDSLVALSTDYQKGVNSGATDKSGVPDGSSVVSVTALDRSMADSVVKDATSQTAFKLGQSSASAIKYITEYDKIPGSPLNGTGAKKYNYVYYKEDKLLNVTYNYKPDDGDKLTVVEQMVGTIL